MGDPDDQAQVRFDQLLLASTSPLQAFAPAAADSSSVITGSFETSFR
jgi:hypothetical protein